MNKVLSIFLICILFLTAQNLLATSIEVRGSVSNDTVWVADTVRVTGNITVESGITLTIRPGTFVDFEGNYALYIQGRILAVGSSTENITFSTCDTTGYYNKSHIGWNGIQFDHTPLNNDTSKLICCVIEYCRKRAIEIDNFNKVSINHCTIRNNYVASSGTAGIMIFNSRTVIMNSKIYNNQSGSGGGIYINHYSDCQLINNCIFNNKSNDGAGIYISGFSRTMILNNTIFSNRAKDLGGGIYYSRGESDLEIRNTIIWGNSATEGSQIYLSGSNINGPGFYFCNIEGGKEGFEGFGPEFRYIFEYESHHNISVKPYFLDVEKNNFQLTDSSFCINAGDPLTDITKFPKDMAGKPRIYDGKFDIIDIGAYEFQGEPVNRRPIIEPVEDQYCLCKVMKMSVNFADADVNDTHVINVHSDNDNVTIANLTGNITGSTYELNPLEGWEGIANITVKVEDSYANIAADTFKLIVTNSYCGNISQDMVWDIDTVKIICDLKIYAGATLTILPGTRIEFQGNYKFDVHGRLLAMGTKFNNITFTVADTSGYFKKRQTGWWGIHFFDIPVNTDSSKLVYCNIQYSRYNNISISNFDKVLISDCNIGFSTERGLYIGNSDIILKNSIIHDNENYYSGGGLYIRDSKCKLINNIIYNNKVTSHGGGGIFFQDSEAELINNTIYGNQSGNLGGGLYFSRDFGTTLRNTVIWGNKAKQGNQVYLFYTGDNPGFYYCNIEGGKEDFFLYGDTTKYTFDYNHQNINSDPFFKDEENNNFYLTDSSSCINAGNPLTDISDIPFDKDGNPRIVGDTVDIGAYEFQGVPANRPPVINEVEDTLMYCNDTLQMKVEYYDPDINDTHTISITADNPHISINNLSGDTSGSTYEIIPDLIWKGSTNIYIEVIDSRGAKDVDTFRVEVKNPFCGRLTGNVTWELDTVKINCDIVVDSTATLTIMPGTVVEFRGPFKLDVRGRLLAEGTPSDHIKFTTSDSLGYNNNSYTGWAGIVFCFTNPDSDTSKLIYCNIEYANNMLYYPSFYSGVVAVKNFSKLVISNCMIRHNHVKYSGALVVYNSQAVIKNNYIINNNCFWSGAGICMHGKEKIQNNVISNYNGWGIVILDGSPEIVNNTICYNGGGIYCRSTSIPTIKNSIVWGNSNYQMFMSEKNMNTEIEYCNIQGGLENIPNNSTISVYENNIDMEPCFTNPLILDYSLTDSSSCINRGTPDTTGLNLPPVDLAGNPRIFDGTVDIIDIGAYEFQGDVNKPPVLTKTESMQNLANTIFKSKVRYYDPNTNDTHTTSIKSDTSAVRIFKVAEEPGRVEYEVIPGYNWIGVANIYIQVTDNHGAIDADTFRLAFTKHTCGIIKENTIWYLDTVKIDCDIIIDSSATLTIMPGTVVEFQGEYMIDVQGALLAEGTQMEPIKFSVADPSGLDNNELVRWKNINFTHVADTNVASQLKYCVLEYNMYNAVNVSQFNNLIISDCIIRYGINSGIYISESNVTVQNCNIYNNHNGIDINISGGYLLNNIISNNSNTGIYLAGSSPEIINNTVCKNSDGLFCGFGSNPVIRNSIFWNNSYDPIFIYKTNNRPEITHCNVQGGQENITFGFTIDKYENNIDLEPYFTDIDNVNYSLTDSSFCINRGTPDTTGLNLPASDITGNSRIIGDTIDIGAYEFSLNFAPSDILLSNNQIDENVRYGSLVGIFSSVDANAEDTHTYSFDVGDGTNDADNSSFVISHDSLKITVYPDHEERDALRIFVKTTDNGYDNLSCSKAFIINILDINEPPVIHLQTFSVNENSPSGTVVDTLEAMDPDEGQTLFYSIISGNRKDAFTIDPFTGEITVNESSALDYETTALFELTMQVEDDGPGNLSTEGPITINLNDVHEPMGLSMTAPGIFRIYPNPVKKILYIEFPDEDHKNLVIEIKSVNERLVYLKEMNEPAGKIIVEIDMSAIPEGLYLLTIKNNKILITRKIVVIK